jgi:hypothetical protein
MVAWKDKSPEQKAAKLASNRAWWAKQAADPAKAEAMRQYKRDWRATNKTSVQGSEAKRRGRMQTDTAYREQSRAKKRERAGMCNPPGELRTGVCPICTRPDMQLVLDHCHETGALRGWVCNPCNRGLGMFQDSAAVVGRAAEYLQKFLDRPAGTE